MSKNKPLNCILVTKENNELNIKEITIKGNRLTAYYDLIKCDLIDIQERYINGILYDFIIDDEYMLNNKADNPKNISAVCIGDNNKPIEIIFSNFIICRPPNNDSGEEENTTKADFENITKSIHIATFKDTEPTKELTKIIKYKINA